MIYLLLTAVHLIICLLVLLGILSGRLSVHKYMFFVVLFLPFWGLLIVLILHYELGFDPVYSAEIDVEKMRFESELYRSITMEDRKSDMTVPIEEALLINSARERRTLIMDVLNDNPGDYVSFLQKAGNNDDTEVVHYAVTAMVEISKENDYMLQKLEAAYTAEPDNMDVLANYCDFLWKCLSQDLMQGQVEVMNRELYSQLMYKKIQRLGTVADYARLAENELKRKCVHAAGELIAKMEEKWPNSEEYMHLKIQYLASLNKGKEIKEFISRMENSDVFLSSKTKEVFSFWAN